MSRQAAPETERGMGRLGTTFQATVTGARRGRPGRERAVTRQTLYAQEEDDYDAAQHVPTRERLEKLAETRLDGNDLYEDPYAEAEEAVIEPTEAEVDQFRADVDSVAFQALARRRSVATDEAAERLRRERLTTQGKHNAEAVAKAMRQRPATALDHVAVEVRRADEAVVGATVPKPDEAVETRVRLIAASEAMTMLHVDCLRGLAPSVKSGFLGLPCVANLVRELQPEMYVHEPDRKHFSVLDLIEVLVSAGAKFESITRFSCRSRLGALLSADFYGPFLRHDGSLEGGHEHYNSTKRETRFVALTFRCVRRAKETAAEAVSSEARREMRRLEAERRRDRHGADLLERAEQEQQKKTKKPERRRHAAYDDPWANSFGDDVDDKYDGGNDLKMPSRHYRYRLDVVCVEACDCEHVDETQAGRELDEPDEPPAQRVREPSDFDILESPPPSPTERPAAATTADSLATLFAFGPDPAAEAKLHGAMMPSGTCKPTIEQVSRLVGKWKGPGLLAALTERDKIAPLCLRSFAFAADTID